MDTLLRAASWALGAAILTMTVTGEHVRWGLVALALVLMGVTTTAQLVDVVRRASQAAGDRVPHSSDLEILDEPAPGPDSRGAE